MNTRYISGLQQVSIWAFIGFATGVIALLMSVVIGRYWREALVKNEQIRELRKRYDTRTYE